MTQELNYLGGSIEEGEVAIIIGALTSAAIFPEVTPEVQATSQPVSTTKEGGVVTVKIGEDVAATFTSNERASGDDEVTYSASGNEQVKGILLNLGLIEEPAEGPVGDSAVEDPAPDA